jgi:glutamyl-tRNA(Gln) amidotransferase subunit E
MIEEIKQQLPELPEKKKKRFIEEYTLSEELADELVLHRQVDLFEKIVRELDVNPVLVATTILNTFKYLKRENVPIDNISEEQLFKTFEFLVQGKYAKEALPDILTLVATHPDKPLDNELLKSAGLTTLSKDEVTTIIREIIAQNEDLVKEKEMDAFGPLMGEVMKQVRGKIDGKTVSTLLKQLLQEHLS